MQSSLPSWLFEHSGPMSLCACLDALMARVVPRALGRASVMYINTKVIACLDVYQAALMRRRTPKHACLQIVLYIYIYIYTVWRKKKLTCLICFNLKAKRAITRELPLQKFHITFHI